MAATGRVQKTVAGNEVETQAGPAPKSEVPGEGVRTASQRVALRHSHAGSGLWF